MSVSRTPHAAAASVDSALASIRSALQRKGGHYATYDPTFVSWDDAARGTVGGQLSSLGPNITDTRLYEKSGRRLFTVRYVE